MSYRLFHAKSVRAYVVKDQEVRPKTVREVVVYTCLLSA